MRTRFLAAGAALCVLGMTGCNNETDATAQGGKQVMMTMETSGPQTRADYNDDGSTMRFSWNSGDKISVVVNGTTDNGNCSLTTAEAGKSVPFTGGVTAWGSTTKDIYAFYPYSSTPYIVTGGDNSQTASATLTLPNPQEYLVDGPITNSFMVGVGKANASGTAISAWASMKQVMSIIKLNITNAPGLVTGVKLKCSEALFPTQANVTLSTAAISSGVSKTDILSMNVTDVVDSSKAVSFAMFPVDLSGKKFQVEVTFAGGETKTIEKNGINFVRNMHYVMAFDAKIEPKTITWAAGNLIADGANGAKIGRPTDCGLYFQFGSLVGWAGGATGDGTGVAIQRDAPLLKLTPTNFDVAGKAWGSTKKTWQSTTSGVPFTASGSDNEKAGVGDPCRYYLGGTWRLPTRDEYIALFKDNGYPSSGPWRWNATTRSAVHDNGLTFTACGIYTEDGYYDNEDFISYSWSSSIYPGNNRQGAALGFTSAGIHPENSLERTYGVNVRCVQEN